MPRRKTIAIVHYSRNTYPLRLASEAHLFAWLRHSRHRVVHINAAFMNTVRALQACQPDAIILHTSLIATRWNDAAFNSLRQTFEAIGDHCACKLALPQDEYHFTDRLNDILRWTGVGIILSCADQNLWPRLYGKLSCDITIRTVLPGYVESSMLRRAARYAKPQKSRQFFVGYRAWGNSFWLGEHGAKKANVGTAIGKELERQGLPHDISINDSDAKVGDDWLRFLGNCRATVGAESGSSLLDTDGTVRACLDDLQSHDPQATLEDARQRCFPPDEGEFKLACLSPRHFEAIATYTAQALVRGEYSGILKPDVHYAPIEPDFSNLSEIVEKLNSDDYVRALRNAAYGDIIESGRYTYEAFVTRVDKDFVNSLPDSVGTSAPFAIAWLRIREWVNWRIVQLECLYIDKPSLFRPFAWLLKPFYLWLVTKRA